MKRRWSEEERHRDARSLRKRMAKSEEPLRRGRSRGDEEDDYLSPVIVHSDWDDFEYREEEGADCVVDGGVSGVAEPSEDVRGGKISTEDGEVATDVNIVDGEAQEDNEGVAVVTSDKEVKKNMKRDSKKPVGDAEYNPAELEDKGKESAPKYNGEIRYQIKASQGLKTVF